MFVTGMLDVTAPGGATFQEALTKPLQSERYLRVRERWCVHKCVRQHASYPRGTRTGQAPTSQTASSWGTSCRGCRSRPTPAPPRRTSCGSKGMSARARAAGRGAMRAEQASQIQSTQTAVQKYKYKIYL